MLIVERRIPFPGVLTMNFNRSVPVNAVLPHVQYRDLAQAIAWLDRVFGFEEHYRYGDPLSGAQLRLGDACIMIKQAGRREQSPRQLGYGTQSLTIFLEDVEASLRAREGRRRGDPGRAA